MECLTFHLDTQKCMQIGCFLLAFSHCLFLTKNTSVLNLSLSRFSSLLLWLKLKNAFALPKHNRFNNKVHCSMLLSFPAVE